MEKIKRWNHSKKSIYGAMLLLFLFILALNCMTPYIADDYVYRLSFSTKQELKSLSDIIPSMYVHCYRMNGRVISHGLEQLFMLAPKLVFNLCNAAVYTGLIYMLYRICNSGKSTNALLFAGIGAAFWYAMPVFGQVALWQVGSLNYLWGLAVGTSFMLPYLMSYLRKEPALTKLWEKLLFSVAALFAGMYTEVTSFIAILLSLCLLVILCVTRCIKWKNWMWIPLILGLVGFLIMMNMPAEANAKFGDMTIETLLQGFNTATEMFREHLLWLLLAWGVLFSLEVYGKIPYRRLVLSGLFAIGAVAANYMLTLASYYPERCMCTSCMLLILACGVLLPELHKGSAGAVRACMGTTLTIVFLFSLVSGSYEIYRNYTNFKSRELLIAQAVAEGQQDLVLPCIHAANSYSPFWGITDLNTEESDTWPNNQMAVYYGVQSISGY